MTKTKATLLFAFIASAHAAFEFPSFPNVFKPPTATLKIDPLIQKKGKLLEAVSFTSNGKTATPERQVQVLEIVADIEKSAKTSPTLLTNAEELKALDGIWYLQYTSPSVVGDKDQFPNAWKPAYATEEGAKIETKPFNAKGSVTAVGITVDTSNRVVQQIFNVQQATVTNVVELDWGRVTVSGRFRPSTNVVNRAIVAFDTADISLRNGLDIKLGFVFQILGLLRGSNDSGWLETTYLGDDIRIGRGNKGTMFVLTRDPDAVQP